MIICPNCQNKELTGAISCSKCGAQLINLNIETHKIQSSEALLETEHVTTPLQTPEMDMQSWISLHMIESGQILPLSDRTEFTLGRSAEGQPIVPDVDLTPYNAYTNGVSRLHAVLKLIQDQVYIMDLGSSNGSFLNGTRLSPYVETPVTRGDVLFLGKLKIQVLID